MLPEELVTDKMVVKEETVEKVLTGKICLKNPSLFYVVGVL